MGTWRSALSCSKYALVQRADDLGGLWAYVDRDDPSEMSRFGHWVREVGGPTAGNTDKMIVDETLFL